MKSYTTDLTDISTCEVIGTWVEASVWTTGAAPALEPDFFIHGANCVAKYWTTGGGGGTASGAVFDAGTALTIPSPGAFFIWLFHQCPNNMALDASGGLRVIMGDSVSAFNGWTVGGRDTITYGGWVCYPVDPAVARQFVEGSPTEDSTRQWFGFGFLQTATAKGGVGSDVLRYGRGQLAAEYGDGSGYATFAGLAAVNDANADTGITALSVNASLQFARAAGSFITDGFIPGMIIRSTGFTNGGNNTTKTISTVAAQTITVTSTTGLVTEGAGADERITGGNRWGLFQALGGGSYLQQGLLLLGTATYPVDFRDSNAAIQIPNTRRVISSFNTIEIRNASSRVDWTNVAVTALGTVSPGTFTVTSDADVNFSGCVFTGMGVFTFLAATDMLGCTFRRCGQIITGGARMVASVVDSYTGAANTSALTWNVNADTDGELDDMVFTKGTEAHHAIELGASSINTLTLRGITFTSFNAGDAENDSVLYLRDQGSDKTWNISTVGCTGTVSYKKERPGDTVNIIPDTKVLTIQVKDADTGSGIDGARVLVTTDTGGPYPYQVSVGITRSGSTATVAHTTHGLVTGNQVLIEGCNQGEYNGVFTITWIDADSYSYTVSGTPATPATGSPISTFVIVTGLTSSGQITSTARAYSSSQPYKGRVRKSTGSPYYKTAPLSGTISAATQTVVVQMVAET